MVIIAAAVEEATERRNADPDNSFFVDVAFSSLRKHRVRVKSKNALQYHSVSRIYIP